MSKMCVCNARMSVLGAPGCARDLELDVVKRKQELAHRRRAWRHGEARLAAGTACRARKKAAGRIKVAVGQGATRGIAGKQEVALGCYNDEQQRGAARADSRAAWQKQGRPAWGRGRRQRGRRGRVARR
jgi:hypothetical protein